MTFSYYFSLNIVYSISDKSFGYYTKDGFQWKYPVIPDEYLSALEGRDSIYECFFRSITNNYESNIIFIDEDFYDLLPKDIDDFLNDNDFVNGCSQNELLSIKSNLNLIIKTVLYLIEEAEGNWYFMYSY